jgi:NAD(P)-dependent dehydrogenase (short-subunit alcohol dehydrogenase family)
MTVRFSKDDLTVFSAASCDRNPLHLSTEFAHRSCYGQRVVFGILGAFACLAKAKPPVNSILSNIILEFPRPIFLDIDYEVIVIEQLTSTRSVSLCDGSRVLIRAEFAFTECAPEPIAWEQTPPALRQLPVDPEDNDLRAGSSVGGHYLPNPTAMGELLRRFCIDEKCFGRLQLSALVWSSYLVGMEQPGLRGLFYKLMLSFGHLEQCGTAAFSYQARVRSLTAFNVIVSDLCLLSKNQVVATGESWALLTPRSPRRSVTTVANLLPSEPHLKDKVAIVVGASRGLGAMLTTALALQGCTVLAIFKSSNSEAAHLRESLAFAPGKITLIQGDAADVTWCEELRSRVLREFGQLDFLVCNACPPLLPLQLESKMVERINSYVNYALALVSVPISVFLQLVEEKSGWGVIISSSAVETTPREWPHYVALKAAIEGLTRVASLQYPTANFLLVRPPRLNTDLTNDPLPHGRAMSAEVAASKIVRRLLTPAKDRVELFCVTD